MAVMNLHSIQHNGKYYLVPLGYDLRSWSAVVEERLPQAVKTEISVAINAMTATYRKPKGGKSKAEHQQELKELHFHNIDLSPFREWILYVMDIRWAEWEQIAALERRLEALEDRVRDLDQ
jgi:hypothetical protein